MIFFPTVSFAVWKDPGLKLVLLRGKPPGPQALALQKLTVHSLTCPGWAGMLTLQTPEPVQKTTWLTTDIRYSFLAMTMVPFDLLSIFEISDKPLDSKRYAACVIQKTMSSSFRCKIGLGFTNTPSEFW